MEGLQIKRCVCVCGGVVGPGQTLNGYKNDFIANCLQIGVVDLALFSRFKGISPRSRAVHTCCARDQGSCEFHSCIAFPVPSGMEGQTPSLPVPLGIPPWSSDAREPHVPPHGAQWKHSSNQHTFPLLLWGQANLACCIW